MGSYEYTNICIEGVNYKSNYWRDPKGLAPAIAPNWLVRGPCEFIIFSFLLIDTSKLSIDCSEVPLCIELYTHYTRSSGFGLTSFLGRHQESKV